MINIINKKLKKREIILQQGRSDCGVACLLSIIKFYEGYESLENLRRISGTNITGTTLLGLCQAARHTGFDADGCEADMDFLKSHDSPCILHVVVGNNLQHYLVCYGLCDHTMTDASRKGKKFVIGDPAKGIVYMTEDELVKIWVSRVCLVLSPNPEFKKAGEIRKTKYKWMMGLLKEDVPLLSIAVGLGIGIALLGLVMAIFSQRLVDEILPKKEYTKFYLGIFLVLALLVTKEGLSYLRQYFLFRQSKEFNTRIIDYFFGHLLHLPKLFFDTRKIGELTARLNDTARIQRVILQLAGNTVIDFLVTIISIIALFSYSWQIGFVCLIAVPGFYFIIYKHNKKIINGQRSVMSSYALAEANYISTLQGIEPIKNRNKQGWFAANNKTVYEFFQEKIFLFGKIQIRLSLLANIAGAFILSGVLALACIQVLHQQLKTGELIAILGMAGVLLPAVANLALVSIPLSEAEIVFDRMFEFTGIEPEDIKMTSTPVTRFDSLRVDQITFRFAGRKSILKDISLEIRKGEIIALVGENGCGKTTLSQILQKNYRAENGSIIINNDLELKEVSFYDWRNILGVVPQNVHLFNGTVLENIAFEDAVRDPDNVIRFIRHYGFWDFIHLLPQSVLTTVGEEGVNLSGGQKQIIGLARALYHHPQFLILDEVTAAMDRESEQFVLGLLKKLKEEMAIIFITHKLHVLKYLCDRIYILSDGAISNHGGHQDLIKGNNLYSQYWAALGGEVGVHR